MQFSKLVGLQATKQQLINMATQGRIPHALMLQGAPGTGVLPMAVAFAQYIMCEDPQPTDSCGVCSNCNKFSKLQHIDVHFSFPIISGDHEPVSNTFIAAFRNAFLQNHYLDVATWMQALEAGNKQPNISAKECRALMSKLVLRSFEGGYKILILWLPEFLGKEGNILLKFLEEPPAKTIVIMATENYEQVLATIQSRTQLVSLPPLTDADIQQALLAQGATATSATQLARMAEGNFLQALQNMQHHADGHFTDFKGWLNVLFTNNGPGITHWVLTFVENSKENQKQFLIYTIAMMEHLVRIKWVGAQNLLLQPEEADIINKLIAKNITEEMANAVAKACEHTLFGLERNGNAKILLQSLSLQLKDIFANKPMYVT